MRELAGRLEGGGTLLASLFEFLRDLAVLAAAIGIARWTWDWHSSGAARRDEAASAAMAADRQATDIRQLLARLDERAAAAARSFELGEMLARAAEARALAQVRIHRLLQTTAEPFMTFEEIERAEADRGHEAGEELKGDGLRRVLIDLVSGGVIAQMDRDRYFIASDFETGSGDESSES